MADRCKNIIGQRFNRLVVLQRAENYIKPLGKGQVAQWLCQCDCGNKIVVRSDSLKSGSVKSCGCLHSEMASELCKSHAAIKVNQNAIRLGYYDNFEDAVEARKNAEEKYFGEYSFDNSMKMQTETNDKI